MGQEQSQPTGQQGSSNIQQSYQYSQQQKQNQFQATPAAVEEGQRKMMKGPNTQKTAAPMFQGSFSAAQSKPLQDEGVDQNYDPLIDSKGSAKKQFSESANNLNRFENPIPQHNTLGTNHQTQALNKQDQLLQLQSELQQQYQIQQQLTPQQQQAMTTQQSSAIPSSKYNTANFGQLEQMMIDNNQSKQGNGEFNQGKQDKQQLSNNNYTNNQALQDSRTANTQSSGHFFSGDQNEQARKAAMVQMLLSQPTQQTHQSFISSTQTDKLVNRIVTSGKQIDARNAITNDFYQQREIEGCTFHPDLKASSMISSFYLQGHSKDQPRTLDHFLEDQYKFLNHKETNIKRIKTEMSAAEKEECPHHPRTLNSSSGVLMASKVQGKLDQPAYERLYDLQRRKKEIEEKKVIDDKEGNLKRKKVNQQTIDRLYVLGKMKVTAKREGKITNGKYSKGKQGNGMKEENNGSEKDPSAAEGDNKDQQMSQFASQKQSEFCLATKLIKEYEQIVAVVVEDARSQNYLLDYIQMSQILRLMGFVSYSEKIESHNFVKERTLVNDVWLMLDGITNAGVSYRNLLLFIFGFMGIDIDLPRFKIDANNVMRIEYSQDHAFPLLKDVAELKSEQVKDQIDQIQQMRASRLSSQPGMNSSQMSSPGFCTSIKRNDGEEEAQGQSLQHKYAKAHIDYSSMDPQLRNWMTQRSLQLKIGEFDADKNLSLNASQVKQIQSTFWLFYVNRLHNEKEKDKNLHFPVSSAADQSISDEKLLELQQKHQQSQRQAELANNYRARVWESTIAGSDKLQQLGDKIQHADILMAQKVELQKHLELSKKAEDQEKLVECTFHPKTTEYTYTSITGLPNNNPMPSIALGNSRNIQLYHLAKPRSQLRDKNTFELEYEKNCDQCTFHPDLAATKEGNVSQNKGVRVQEIKNKDVTIDRMRRAYEDSQQVQQKLSRGYFEFKNQRKTTEDSRNHTEGSRNHTNQSRNEQLKPSAGFKRPFTGSPQLDTGLLSTQVQHYHEQQQQQGRNNLNQQQFYQPKYQNIQKQYFPQGNNSSQQGDNQMNGNYLGQDWMNNNNNSQNQHEEDNSNNGTSQQQVNHEWQNPLMYVDINLSGDKLERIVVYPGDRPEDLARQFIAQHGLDAELQDKLTKMLEMQIQNSLGNQAS